MPNEKQSTQTPAPALDYAALGFKCGLEIHQRLDTRKLFGPAYANPTKTETPLDPAQSVKLERRLRAVVGETGAVDASASFEAQRGKHLTYYAPPLTSGAVETDDEPPLLVSSDALRVALTIALLLGSRPVDEFHVMRKTIVDGSSPSGFQRTGLLALGGSIQASPARLPNGTDAPAVPVAIQTVLLEEESAGIVDEIDGKRVSHTFRLDRLGIPLVEIATDPVIQNGVHAQTAAMAIGKLLRSTGRVQRGLGTIRQDLNVSIAKGNRVEIKGAQTLDDIPNLIDNEVRRQLALVAIRDELHARNPNHKNNSAGGNVEKTSDASTHANSAPIDVTDLLTPNAPKFASTPLSQGQRFFALSARHFAGLLGVELMPNHRLGTELKDYLTVATGVSGILHSDEPLSKYGWTDEQNQALADAVSAKAGDALIVYLCPPGKATPAFNALLSRLHACYRGVPAETRRADGQNSRFMRPLSGASRLYPETDHPPVPLTPALIQTVRDNLPPSPESRQAAYEKIGLNAQIASRLVASDDWTRFDAVRLRTKADPTLVATTILETLVSFKRDGVAADALTDDALVGSLDLVAKNQITKAALPELLKKLATRPRASPALVAKESGLERAPYERVVALVRDLNAKGVTGPKVLGELLRAHRLTVDPADASRAAKGE